VALDVTTCRLSSYQADQWNGRVLPRAISAHDDCHHDTHLAGILVNASTSLLRRHLCPGQGRLG
jgi:hypothetical protein